MSDSAGSRTARAHVLPLDRVLVLQPDETVMGAALAAGLRWPTICGGNANCGVCALELMNGRDAVEPIVDPEEESLLRNRPDTARGPIRLACRLRLRPGADVTVFKRGVRSGS
jgi:2Fe-2S ferredoxin